MGRAEGKDKEMVLAQRRKVAEKQRDDLDDLDGWPSETKDKDWFHGLKMKNKGRKWPRFHSTFDIIRAVEAGEFPDKAMMTVHPQRWTNNPLAWTKELVWQNCKNIVKRLLIRQRETRGGNTLQ